MDTHLQKVKKTYPALFKRQWPCNFTLPFAPLVISSCNGDGGVQFSKAALNVTADINDAISEIFLYRGVYYDIVEKMTFDSSKCLDCLGKYLNDGRFDAPG